MAWPRIKNSRSSAESGTHTRDDGVQATVAPAPGAEATPGSGQNTGVNGTRHAVVQNPTGPTPTDSRLRALCRLLEADPADGRTLSELGREVGAAERTLSRLFREQTGISFPQWRGQLRLHHALALLVTGRPVTRVAADCGYRSPSAFIEAFRAAFGTTPGRYMSSHEAAPEQS